MRDSEARQIAAWRYEGEYALYNTRADQVEEAVRTYLNPAYTYHAVWHDAFGLAGFCCYGLDAQAPGGDYAEEAVDIGLGMRPDLIGQGLGQTFLQAILEHATDAGKDVVFRATIAEFNGRSLRLFERAGFRPEQSFTVSRRSSEQGTVEFVVVVKRPV